jgi:hypothetical protein
LTARNRTGGTPEHGALTRMGERAMTSKLTVLGMTSEAERLALHATVPVRTPEGSARMLEVAASVLAA